MANAKQCDRCNQFYNIPIDLINYKDISFNGIGLINYNQRSSRPYTIDLCPTCLNDVNAYISNPDSAIVVPENPEEPEIEISEDSRE